MLLRRVAALSFVLVVASACQTVMGDFTVGPAPPEESSRLGTACEPDEYQCTGSALERCNDKRNGFVLAEMCKTPAECDLNTRSCRRCVYGEHMCRENMLERCDQNGVWLPVADGTCATAALCEVASDRMSGSCTPPVCAAGVHACEGAMLVRCTDGRDGTEPVALCENPELCDPAFADELASGGERGACRPPACEPDEWRCDGATLRHCTIDRKSWTDVSCDSAVLCSASSGACGPCTPEAIECNGAELRECTAAGEWRTLDTCEAVALCDVMAGRCRSPACAQPGLLRCGTGILPALERCSEGLVWEIAEVCVTAELCSVEAGRCLEPACDALAVRCRGNELQRCSADRTYWEVTATCATGERCEPDTGCVPGPCTEGTVRCNGPSVERCASAVFEEVERCAAVELCDPVGGACNEDMCPFGPFDCTPDQKIMQCRMGHDGYDELARCEGEKGLCDTTPTLSGDRPECDACPANEFRCEGSVLTRCSSDGQAREKVADCPVECNAATATCR